MYKDKRKEAEKQERTRQRERQLVNLRWPLLVKLNEKLDRRLVNTLLGLVMAIVIHRHRNNGLLLSELGSRTDRGLLLAGNAWKPCGHKGSDH